MKKWIVLILVTGIVASVQAEEKSLTKQQYVKQQMEWARKDKSWNPTKPGLEAWFDEMDTDGDGLLTPDEAAEGKKKAQEARKAKAAKKAQAAKKDQAAKKPKEVKKSEGQTKSQYVKQQMEWARKDKNWNPTKPGLEARFDEDDTDGDGVLTPEEAAEGRKKAQKARKAKAAKKTQGN